VVGNWTQFFFTLSERESYLNISNGLVSFLLIDKNLQFIANSNFKNKTINFDEILSISRIIKWEGKLLT